MGTRKGVFNMHCSIAHRRRREEKKDVGGEQSTETGEGQSNNNQGSREKSGGRGNE